MITDNPRRRRWYQFRLRTLLIAILVLSLPLSWFAVRMERARKQREAVQEVLRLGGNVTYDWDWSQAYEQIRPSPSWYRKLLGDDFFDRVVSIDLNGPDIDDAALERVNLERLGTFRTLCLSETAITEIGLAKLGGLRVETFHFYQSPIADAGLKNFANFPTLRRLSLMECWQITDDGLDQLGRLSQLEYLDLSGTKATDTRLAYLSDLSHLETLCLYQTVVTADGVEALRDALPGCEISFSGPLDPNDPANNPFATSDDDGPTVVFPDPFATTPPLSR